MPWHPPIPAEAVYSDEAAQLGAGLRLLWYLYNGVQRDGTVAFSPKRAAKALNVPYETARNWWQALRPLGIVTVEADRGKQGYTLRFADDWLDWRVLAANYSQGAALNGSSIDFQRSNVTADSAQRSFNGSSIDFQRSNVTADAMCIKEDHQIQESPTPPQPPRARAVPNQAMVMMMMGKGIKSERNLNEIASMGLDLATVEQSIDNLLADRTGIGAIVKLLQSNPPEPGKPYPRARAPAALAPGPTATRPPPDISKRTNGAKLAELRKELGV